MTYIKFIPSKQIAIAADGVIMAVVNTEDWLTVDWKEDFTVLGVGFSFLASAKYPLKKEGDWLRGDNGVAVSVNYDVAFPNVDYVLENIEKCRDLEQTLDSTKRKDYRIGLLELNLTKLNTLSKAIFPPKSNIISFEFLDKFSPIVITTKNSDNIGYIMRCNI